MDIAYYEHELRKLAEKGNLRHLPLGEHEGSRIIVDGESLLNLSSNDYLGLAADEDLRSEFREKSDPRNWLFSSSSSRLLTGNFSVCNELEKLLASLYGAESALVFGSGYQMNVGILPAVADTSTLILADKLVHASLVDGIRLSSGRCIRYRHQDYCQLEKLLSRHASSFRQVIVVTESIFSMDGDVAPLGRLVDLKRAYPHLMLYVDEAHAVGVRGPSGLGVAEEQGCAGGIDFLCGTFGKALASAGAYVVCRGAMRSWLVNRMRPFIFSTALPPLNWEWTKFIVSNLSRWEERRRRLFSLSSGLNSCLDRWGTGGSSSSHIVPVVMGDSFSAVRLAEHLQHRGFYVLPVRPPAVVEGTARVRISLSAAFTSREIDGFCRELGRALDDLKEMPGKGMQA